jgi:hypothetical protein
MIKNHTEEPSGQLSTVLTVAAQMESTSKYDGVWSDGPFRMILLPPSSGWIHEKATSETSVHYYQTTRCHIVIIVPDIRTKVTSHLLVLCLVSAVRKTVTDRYTSG